MSGILDPEGAHLAALRRVADFKNLRVLEVGCGDGRLTLPLAEEAATVLAFDPDAEAIARAQAALPASLASRIAYQTASATEVDVPRCTHDLVLFSWSL